MERIATFKQLKYIIMGFLSEIKKLLFVKKSVAKSATEKSGDYVKEKAEDLAKASKEFAKDTGKTIGQKTSGLRDAVMEKSKDLVEKGKDALEEIGEKGKEVYDDLADSEVVKKAADFTEDLGEKVLDTGEKILEKAKGISEDVGKKVLDKSKEAADAGKGLSEKIGSKVLDAKDDLGDKFKEISEDFSEKLDETIAKAQKMEAEEEARPKQDFADETLDTSESLLSGTDDFFEKAARFADGDYEAIREGTTSIIEPDESEKKPPAKAAGFEDLDGDGNEMIDDALIIEDSEEE